jgi:iron(III) transport system substrate-binding protein
MSARTRRAVLRIGVLGLAASGAACAGAGPPQAGAGSAGGRAVPAPAQGAHEAAPGAGWGEVAAAAEREGALSLLTLVNRGWAAVIERFQEEFPGVVVHRTAESSAATWSGVVRRAAAAGGGSFDLAFVQPRPALAEERAGGPWAPLRPLLLRPDVLDDGAWRGGLGARFLDPGAAVCFDWEHQVHHAYLVKTDLVGAEEISSVGDLLDPKWRGKVLSSDPRTGNALLSAAAASSWWGDEVLRRLLVDQRPAFISGSGWDSSLATAFVRGPYPIAQGLRPKPLADARAQGLAQHLRYLDLPDADFVPSTALLSLDQAPHPAAARLFANWILTREGQTVLTSSLPTNSARTDVPPFEPDGIGGAGNAYFEPDTDASEAHVEQTATRVRSLLRAAA